MAEAQLDAKSSAVPATRHITRNLGHRIGGLGSHGILLLYSALALFPIILIVINSFKDRKDLFRVPYQPPIWFSLQNGLSIINISSSKGYEQVFARADVVSYFVNSLIVTTFALLFIMLTGAMASYALAE